MVFFHCYVDESTTRKLKMIISMIHFIFVVSTTDDSDSSIGFDLLSSEYGMSFIMQDKMKMTIGTSGLNANIYR